MPRAFSLCALYSLYVRPVFVPVFRSRRESGDLAKTNPRLSGELCDQLAKHTGIHL